MKARWSVFPLSLLFVVAVAQENAGLSKEELAAQLPGVEAYDIADSPIPGIYELAVGSTISYVTNDGRYFLQGDLYDLEDNENLTEKRRARARVALLAGIDPETMIVFSPKLEDLKYSVTIFTDIDCGYCRQFHREIAQVNALGIEVRYLAYPRTGPDTESWDKADRVWCAEDRNNALTQAKLGGRLPDELCDATPVSGHWDLGHMVGVRGTPTILNTDGMQIGGYLTPARLLERLEELTAQPE